jgi:hypothetical protein
MGQLQSIAAAGLLQELEVQQCPQARLKKPEKALQNV